MPSSAPPVPLPATTSSSCWRRRAMHAPSVCSNAVACPRMRRSTGSSRSDSPTARATSANASICRCCRWLSAKTRALPTAAATCAATARSSSMSSCDSSLASAGSTTITPRIDPASRIGTAVRPASTTARRDCVAACASACAAGATSSISCSRPRRRWIRAHETPAGVVENTQTSATGRMVPVSCASARRIVSSSRERASRAPISCRRCRRTARSSASATSAARSSAAPTWRANSSTVRTRVSDGRTSSRGSSRSSVAATSPVARRTGTSIGWRAPSRRGAEPWPWRAALVVASPPAGPSCPSSRATHSSAASR